LRIARNTQDLLSIVEILEAKEIRFVSQKENIENARKTKDF